MTDVFELQLAGLTDGGTALSIGIALRRAFCCRLGIEEEEVGVAVRQGRAHDETIQQSIFLYDAATGGNGYVAALRDHVIPALRDSVDILDCVRKCDAACHGCLLTYDTQYDSIRLDRHKARAFFTDEFLNGLDLPERHRLLGPSSRMLNRLLWRHVAEVAEEPGIEEIRLWVAGDSDAWDVETFPLYRAMLRWALDGRRVHLLVAPDTWSRLDNGSRHALAALATMAGDRIEVHQAPAPTANSVNGVLIAAAGGQRQSSAWAVPTGTGAPMNEAWGQPSGGDPAVCARFETPLQPILTSAIEIDRLRPTPEGTVAILPIRKELDGRVEGFGSRFWSSVQTHCTTFKEQFDNGGPLRCVSYSDRYLATPWTQLLLREVLLELVREKRADTWTTLRLLTREVRPNLRPLLNGRSINNQWQDDAAKRLFVARAFETGRGRLRWKGVFELELGLAPHFRELRLEWTDGAAWSLKLDQGFGYWRCRPSLGFPFDEKPDEQVQTINNAAKRGRVVSQGSYPTYVYLTAESTEPSTMR